MNRDQIFNLWIFISTASLLYDMSLLNVDWIREWTDWAIRKHIPFPLVQNEKIIIVNLEFINSIFMKVKILIRAIIMRAY